MTTKAELSQVADQVERCEHVDAEHIKMSATLAEQLVCILRGRPHEPQKCVVCGRAVDPEIANPPAAYVCGDCEIEAFPKAL